jgi:pimeloyl-ACP methyl ester carboxylesterase
MILVKILIILVKRGRMATKFLKHQNGQIAYDDAGTGPLVICVPSLGDLRGEYRHLRPQLVAAGYRVVTMDVRGHGETSTQWDDFSVAGVGEDILALTRDLGAGPAIVVGTSMGGGAAIWSAVEAPDLIRGMILVDPFVDGEGDRFLQLLFSVMFARPWGPAVWLKYYSTLYPTCKPADFAEYVAALGANLKERGRLEAMMKMLYASKKASEERIPKVTQPALVLMGSKDPDFKNPEAEAKRVAEALHSRYVMIEDAGHYPHAEMPEATAPLMISFMNSLKKG